MHPLRSPRLSSSYTLATAAWQHLLDLFSIVFAFSLPDLVIELCAFHVRCVSWPCPQSVLFPFSQPGAAYGSHTQVHMKFHMKTHCELCMELHTEMHMEHKIDFHTKLHMELHMELRMKLHIELHMKLWMKLPMELQMGLHQQSHVELHAELHSEHHADVQEEFLLYPMGFRMELHVGSVCNPNLCCQTVSKQLTLNS